MKLKKFIILFTTITIIVSTFSIKVLGNNSNNLSGGQLLKSLVLEETVITELDKNLSLEDISSTNATYLQSYVEGNDEIKEIYGGCYIDDSGKLHVLFTKNTKSDVINNVNTILESSVVNETCKYSLDELMLLKEHISNTITSNENNIKINNLSESIVTVGVYEQYNKVIVRLKNCNDEKINLFKSLISNSDAIMFENANEFKNTATTLYTGSRIYVQTDSGRPGCSIGFRCRILAANGSYYNGFMTAAHGNSAGDAVYYNNTYIGHILAWYNANNGKVDAAFVYVSNSNYSPSNTLHRGLGTLVSGAYVNSYQVGRTVYMIGSTSAYRSGKIISSSVDTFSDDNVNILDCVEVDCICRDGDSGGVVYVESNDSYYVNGLILGVFSDDNGTETSSAYVKIGNIKNVYNITLY